MNARKLPVHLVVTTFRRGDKVYHNYLLRHTYREDGKVKNKTVANLSHLPLPIIEQIRDSLSGKPLCAVDDIELVKSLPHGHVAAAFETARNLDVDTLLSSRRCRERDIVMGMLVSRIVNPASKLSTSQLLTKTTLASLCEIEDVKPIELYNALDWLYERQDAMQKKLVQKHVAKGSPVLYDLSSSWVEGTHCPLAAYGYSRDSKKNMLQIEYGLLASKDGCPVAVEVFPGDTPDHKTVEAQVEKVTVQYGIDKITVVGDCGMVTQDHIDTFKEQGGIQWITALRHEQVRAFFENQKELLLPIIAEEEVVAEYADDKKYPGERLVVCRNGALAEKLHQDRRDLCSSIVTKLEAVKKRVANPRSTCHSKEEIMLAVERVFTPRVRSLRQFFPLVIEDGVFSFEQNETVITERAQYDGIFILRTSIPKEEMDTHNVVHSYKSLARVENHFRHLKMDLGIRPIFHWKEERVRSHVFLCMLAEYVRWHMEQSLASLLYVDDTPQEKTSPIHAPEPSLNAKRKASSGLRDDGLPVHSFQTLLADLATIVRATVHVHNTPDDATFIRETLPTPVQQRALTLLGVKIT